MYSEVLQGEKASWDLFLSVEEQVWRLVWESSREPPRAA
jgi:hypothetical protein